MAENQPEATIMLTGKTYDRLKFVVQVLSPGLSALYFGLAQIWGLPQAEKVVGTFAVVTVFLGLILRASMRAYEKSGAGIAGDMVVEYEDDEPSTLSMQLKDQPLNLVQGKTVTFRVKDGKQIGQHRAGS